MARATRLVVVLVVSGIAADWPLLGSIRENIPLQFRLLRTWRVVDELSSKFVTVAMKELFDWGSRALDGIVARWIEENSVLSTSDKVLKCYPVSSSSCWRLYSLRASHLHCVDFRPRWMLPLAAIVELPFWVRALLILYVIASSRCSKKSYGFITLACPMSVKTHQGCIRVFRNHHADEFMLFVWYPRSQVPTVCEVAAKSDYLYFIGNEKLKIASSTTDRFWY